MKYFTLTNFFFQIVFLIIHNISFAQTQISVKSFIKQENDLSARVYSPKKDQNGDICAIIKVVTLQTDFRWDSDGLGIVAVIPKDGEYWVYVPWGAKRLTIIHPKLGILRDYIYPLPIEKSTVYILELVTGKIVTKIENEVIESQWLVINSTPSGADIYIDDKPSNQTPYQSEMPLGRHTYSINHDMYLPTAGFVILTSDKKETINITLKPNFGKLNISSTPENGASVSIDGQTTDYKTPCTIDKIKSGEHIITLRLNMFETYSQKVTILPEGNVNLQVPMISTFADITINTIPASEIYVSGEFKGNSSWIGRLLPGIYNFEARKEKYLSAFEKKELFTGEKLTISLSPTPKTGILKVISVPTDATIFINNEEKGTSPTTLRDLLIGDYTLKLSKTGYSTIIKHITITEGETVSVNENLSNGKEISIISDPPNANVVIDDILVGQTPLIIKLSYGNHKVRVNLGAISTDSFIDINQTDAPNSLFLNLNQKISNQTISSITDDQKLLNYRKALSNTSLISDKSNIIRSLGQVRTFLSLVTASSFLDDEQLKGDAALAVMEIALPYGKLSGMRGVIVRNALNKALKCFKSNESENNKTRINQYLSVLGYEDGLVPMFNGKDLTGWQGLVGNPVSRQKMDPKELELKQQEANQKISNNWSVKDGCIVFNGSGDNLCSVKKYGDFEMVVDWRITKKGDSGIYLRGSPQVQIWDTSRVEVGAQVGSGGLYINQKNPAKPTKVADNPVGDWNTFRIKMVGERVTVYLNGQLVVDNVVLENYWDRKIPIFPKESIELQAHGTDIAFRDIYLQELNNDGYTVTEVEAAEGFKSLFNGKNLEGWTGNTVDYKVENGEIVLHGVNDLSQGNLFTVNKYGDFIYRFEFQLTLGAKSGLGIRTALNGNAAYVGMELPILDNEDPINAQLQPYQYHGSIYGVIPAKKMSLKPIGQWNYQEVVAKGTRITVKLNGDIILNGDIKEASKNFTATLDNKVHIGLLCKDGHIGFVGHGSVVKFRNIRLKDLNN